MKTSGIILDTIGTGIGARRQLHGNFAGGMHYGSTLFVGFKLGRRGCKKVQQHTSVLKMK